MTDKVRKILALMCALVLAITCIGLAAFAEDGNSSGEAVEETVQEEVIPQGEEPTEDAAAQQAAEEAAAQKAAEEAAAQQAAEEAAAQQAAEEAAAQQAAEEAAAQQAAEEAAAQQAAEEAAAQKAAEEAAAQKAAEEAAAQKAAEEAAAQQAAEEAAAQQAAEEAAAQTTTEEEPEKTEDIFVTEGDELVKYQGNDKEVTIPDGIRVIRKNAFAGNTTVEKITLPDSVEEIQTLAFDGAKKLESVVIGSNSKLEKIASGAFRGCAKLDISFAEDVADVADDAFEASLVTETEAAEEAAPADTAEEEKPVAGPAAAPAAAAPTDTVEEAAPGAAFAFMTKTDNAETDEPETGKGKSDNLRGAAVVITKEPVNCVAALQTPATFKVTATGVKGYQWQRKAPGGDWTNVTAGISGKTAAEYKVKVTAAQLTYEFRCELTQDDGTKVYAPSNDGTVCIINPIEEQPVDPVAGIGENAEFSVVGIEEITGYQWQRSKDGTTWTNVTAGEGKTEANYSVPVTATQLKNQFRCELTGPNGDKYYTNIVKIIEGIVVKTEPEDCVAALQTPATFKVEATGVAAYQWQRRAPEGEWVNVTAGISGKTAAEYKVKATAAQMTYEFRCVLTPAAGDPVIVPLNDETVSIINPIKEQPADPVAGIGENAEFSVVGIEEITGYQWQRSKDGTTWTNVTAGEGKTEANYSVPVTATQLKNQFRCELTDADGNTYYTDIVKIVERIVVTTEPENCVAALGTNAAFSIKASGVTAYQWQRRAPEGEWTNVTAGTGKTAADYSVKVTAAQLSYEFQCVLTQADGTTVTVPGDGATVHIINPIEEQPVDAIAGIGENAEFSVVGIEEITGYQWQRSKDGTTWTNVTAGEGKTEANYSVPVTATQLKNQFRCELTDDNGKTYYTNIVKIIEGIVIKSEPENCTAALNKQAVFTVDATGVTAYQWQRKAPEGEWTNVTAGTGKTAAEYSVKVTAAQLTYQFRCELTRVDGEKFYVPSDEEIILCIELPDPVVIRNQPENAFVDSDTEAGVSFEVVVEDEEQVESYQWQTINMGAATPTWAAVTYGDGRTTNKLTITATKARVDRYRYRCVMIGKDGLEYISDEAYMIRNLHELTPVNVLADVNSKIAEPFMVIPGWSATFSTEFYGATDYEWQTAVLAEGQDPDTLADEAWVVASSDRDYSRAIEPGDLKRAFRCKVTGDGEQDPVTTDPFVCELFEGFDEGNIHYSFVYDEDGVIEQTSSKLEVAVGGLSATAAAAETPVTSLTVPSQPVDGLLVTEVAEAAFKENEDLASIDLPDSITVIRKQAFYGCTSLSEMN